MDDRLFASSLHRVERTTKLRIHSNKHMLGEWRFMHSCIKLGIFDIGVRRSQSQIENHEPVIRAVRGKFIWKFNFSVEQKRTRREHRLLCVYAAHAIVSHCRVECFGWLFSGWIVDKNTIIFGRLIIIKCVHVQCSAISTMWIECIVRTWLLNHIHKLST